VRRLVLLIGAAALWFAMPWPPAAMQGGFVDDARRSVVLPQKVGRVFAAGAPAEVLLYTLVPEMLVGRNRLPEGDAIEFYPPQYRTPILIRQLPEVDNPAADAELLAIGPDVYVDYGTVQEDYIAAVDAVQRRTRVPGIILDGALTRIPDTYRRLGTALGVAARGNQLGAAADRLLARYRGTLAAGPSPVRVYLACSGDGFVPCLADEPAGAQLAWLGGINVAGTRATAPRRPLTIDEIRALRPQAIVVAGGPGTAARLRAHPAWKELDAVTAGRVYQFPGQPYGWGARPPSVNRLPGVVWLAHVLAGRPFDAAFVEDIRGFYRQFYHLQLTDQQVQTLVAP
jgi:iron complex transport system substrate-binding protein